MTTLAHKSLGEHIAAVHLTRARLRGKQDHAKEVRVKLEPLVENLCLGTPWTDAQRDAIRTLSGAQTSLDHARWDYRDACDALAEAIAGDGGAEPLFEPETAGLQLGLQEKFIVLRNDGSSRRDGKHFGCEYFVLDIKHDKFARAALSAYATACEGEFPELAEDLRARWGSKGSKGVAGDGEA